MLSKGHINDIAQHIWVLGDSNWSSGYQHLRFAKCNWRGIKTIHRTWTLSIFILNLQLIDIHDFRSCSVSSRKTWWQHHAPPKDKHYYHQLFRPQRTIISSDTLSDCTHNFEPNPVEEYEKQNGKYHQKRFCYINDTKIMNRYRYNELLNRNAANLFLHGRDRTCSQIIKTLWQGI